MPRQTANQRVNLATSARKRYASREARVASAAGYAQHRFAEIDDQLVWDIVESKLPTLLREVAALREKGCDS